MIARRLRPDAWGAALTLAALALLGAGRPAYAACSVSVTAGISFGSYDVFSPTPVDTTGNISYRCDQGHDYTAIRISLTRGRSTTYAARVLAFGADLLQYNLFLDPARTVVWGDGSEGSGVLSDAGTSLNRQNVPVYARIRPGQDARPGPYNDSVTVVIDF